jgi:C4-dicarboxylate transporter DctM subunit
MLAGINKWIWVAVPLFILLGNLMNEGGATERLTDLSNKLVGHISGGLSHVNVFVSMLLAGMSGSIIGDAAGVGKILIPAMKKEGYSGGYSACITATSACIGAIIPPSVTAIFVGTLGDISIMRLWFGGVIPGIIVGLLLMITGYFICKRKRYAAGRKRAPIREMARSIKSSAVVLVLPIIILGGMRLGIFTPTEAAAAGIFYAILVGFFIYRELTIKRLATAAWDTGKTSGAVLWLLAMGILFGTVLHLCQAGEIITKLALGITQNKVIFLIAINVILLILGLFMDMAAVTLILLPITLPLAKAFGVNPVHFGVLFNMVILLGSATPPFGVNVYVTSAIAECTVEEYAKDGWMLWSGMVVSFMLVTFVPQLTLWLPNVLLAPRP